MTTVPTVSHKVRYLFIGFVLLITAPVAYSDTTLTFSDNTSPVNPFPESVTNLSPFHPPPATMLHYSVPFSIGAEFRYINGVAGGVPSGGTGDRNISIINGGEQWVFNNGGLLVTVIGTPSNPGAVAGSAPLSNSNITLWQHAVYFGQNMNRLAPTTTSLAGLAYGPASIDVDTINETIKVFFPVLEQQWGAVWYPLGLADNNADGVGDGVTFTGTISNVVACGCLWFRLL